MSKESKIELLPCQCGGKAAFHSGEGCDGCHYIHCPDCGAMTDYSDKVDPSNSSETLDQLRELCASMWNRRASLPVGVPDGWKLVPVEPTRTMLHRAYDNNLMPWISRQSTGHDCAAGIWESMLAAAPAAPTVKAEQCMPCGGWGVIAAEPGDPVTACEHCSKAPSLPAAGSAVEEVEVVGVVKYASPLPGYTEFMKHEPWMDDGLSEGWQPLMTVAQHERIVAALSAQQSAPVTNEPSPLEVIGYASPGQVAILRELPRTGGMKVKGRKDDRYSEPVVLLSDARAAMLSLAARCQQEGAFKACLECGYQDGHDEICQFHASNRKPQQSAPDRVSVPVAWLRVACSGGNEAWQALEDLRALLASHGRGESNG